ncbi:hypothetical protein [Gemmatimonas aurantiaca]|uniref:alpha-glutamyl/putrescinyl thymine pyrophosphorylase clade 3 protein n=1 Tax=Gemmatimonas aurantiaca TaxID=173480 RepID=UPI00301BFD2F
MIRPKDIERATALFGGIETFERETGKTLRGIADPLRRNTLVFQLVESLHRISYPRVMMRRPLGPDFADPDTPHFNPLLAAIMQLRAGNRDEAFWLVFLFVHFGQHARGQWRYSREVYGRLGQGGQWNWVTISQDPPAFRAWLDANQAHLRRPGCGFGNHRKRESLDAHSPRGTGAAVETYVKWVLKTGSHDALIQSALSCASYNGSQAFDVLYVSMNDVASFGRTARFDYLTMVGKLGLASISPGSPYLRGATGPLTGARLLLNDDISVRTSWVALEQMFVELDGYLGVGMQALEDAICNWQKAPTKFRGFRG